MKEVFENIKEKIKNQPIEQFVDNNGNWDLVQTVLDCCCEAVDRVKEEYNNGWIPCGERLPEEDGVYIISFEECSGLICCAVAYFSLNHPKCKWWDLESEYERYETVVAWQPLPNPFKPIAE